MSTGKINEKDLAKLILKLMKDRLSIKTKKIEVVSEMRLLKSELMGLDRQIRHFDREVDTLIRENY